MYILGLGGLYTTIEAPNREEIFLRAARRLSTGRRPEGTAAALGNFLPEVGAAIFMYIARRDPRYIINIYTAYKWDIYI